MWVYQEPEKDTTSALSEKNPSTFSQENDRGEPPELLTSSVPSVVDTVKLTQKSPDIRDSSRRKLALPSKDCILLAVAYLWGTLFAGILQALCDTAEKETLTYYLHCWQNIFAVSTPMQAVTLFGAEFAVVIGAAVIILLLGLSAVGPLPIFLFVMLYGTGSGLVSAQLFTGLDGKQRALFLLAASLPSALAAGALCLFGASALQVSSRIHAFSFGRGRNTAHHTAGAQLLLGQFVLLAVSFCPLCGAATGFVCLTNRLLQQG